MTASQATQPQALKAGTARSSRRSHEERPPALWGSFPLVELCILVGLVLLLVGFIGGGDRGPVLVLAGLALASIGGFELAIREHFSGFRSHSTLLAGIPAVATLAGLFYLGPDSLPPLARVAVALAVGAASLWILVRIFRQKAGVSMKLR
ncbi:MAG: hypothetical protein M3383_04975 [Actinomycetota bacterium]|nr:hypothetical protein [Actinomycetota bacterium]